MLPTTEELFNDYSHMIYRLCMRYTKDSDSAQDMVQEIFIKVHLKRERFDGKSKVFTWLYRVACNHCLDYLRSCKRRVKLYEKKQEMDVFPIRPDNNSDRILNKMTLQRLLDRLDERNRKIFMLYFGEGMTQEEVAQVLGVSRVAVAKRIIRVRKQHLKPLLEESFVSSSEAAAT